MRYLGLDLGSKTLGIAMSDPSGTIATTYKTIFFDEDNYDKTIEELKKIISNYDIKKIVLGFPKNMNNTIGTRAEVTLEYKRMLEDNFDVEIELYDERLTSVISNSILIEADMSRKKRKKKVDSLAAQIILQDYIDRERNEKNG